MMTKKCVNVRDTTMGYNESVFEVIILQQRNFVEELKKMSFLDLISRWCQLGSTNSIWVPYFGIGFMTINNFDNNFN